jgi:hypothetical protein
VKSIHSFFFFFFFFFQKQFLFEKIVLTYLCVLIITSVYIYIWQDLRLVIKEEYQDVFQEMVLALIEVSSLFSLSLCFICLSKKELKQVLISLRDTISNFFTFRITALPCAVSGPK